MLNNGEGLMDFLNRMADMISSKISERVLLEQLTVTTSELRAVINAVGQGIIAIDKRGIVIHFNKMAQDLLQLAPESIVGKSIRLITPCDALLEVIEKDRDLKKKKLCLKERTRFVYWSMPSRSPANNEVMGVAVIQI